MGSRDIQSGRLIDFPPTGVRSESQTAGCGAALLALICPAPVIGEREDTNMPTTPPPSGVPRLLRRGSALAALLLLSCGSAAHAAVRRDVAVASAACANTSLMPSAHDTAAVGGSIVCLINAIRAQHGLSPLVANRALNTSAMGHSRDMLANDYFGHNSLSGHTPAQRMMHQGAPCRNGCVLGENIAWVTGVDSTPLAVVQAWMASPGHRSNILDPDFRYEGLGVADGAPNGQGATTVTQDFDS
jgi:uncharacterized protein YkwD